MDRPNYRDSSSINNKNNKMKITTGTTEVEHGDVNAPILSIVEGRIIQISLRDNNAIRVEGVYEQPDGTLILNFDIIVKEEEASALYQAVSPALSGSEEWIEETWILFYSAMIPIANERFNTTSFNIV